MLAVLQTEGNRIVNAGDGSFIRLRGVNRSGLEYSSTQPPGSLARAGFSLREMDEIADWGANIIRLPLNQDWALAKPGYDPEPYLEAIDWVIEQAASREMYTLLDLQWLDAIRPRGTLQDGSSNFVPALPDARTAEFWTRLALRYRGETSVLYDLLNEPHDPLGDDGSEYLAATDDARPNRRVRRRVGISEWAPWVRQLAGAIRSHHPTALIFVSGLHWGYDLGKFPIQGVENVVYSSHVYPNKMKSWDRAWGKLSETHPVFVGEFGGIEKDLQWGEKLLDYLDQRFIGWAAWSWADHPHLLRRETAFEPTPFGAFVRDSLRRRYAG